MYFVMQDLIGKTFDTVARQEFKGNSGVIFKSKPQTYMLVHLTCCCSHVWLEDVTGDLSDLENSVIVKAEQRRDITKSYEGSEDIYWTFYEIATNKGNVTLRFCGPDNYYSISVELIELHADGGYERIESGDSDFNWGDDKLCWG